MPNTADSKARAKKNKKTGFTADLPAFSSLCKKGPAFLSEFS